MDPVTNWSNRAALLRKRLAKTHDENVQLRNRLAAIESQVLWRTEDMPQYAKAWMRYYAPGCGLRAAWILIDQSGTEQWKPAPKERPDGRPSNGPLFLPILDPEGT